MYFDPRENLIHPLYSLQMWSLAVGGLAFIIIFVSMLNLLTTRGASGIGVFFSELKAMVFDVFSLSPRRIWALARLTYMEAYRRKALSVFVVFALLFMFAGWFMTDTGEITPDRVKVYISFVLTTITWLTLPVVLILCCFGIPEDIRLRSIHTIVTKPVRRIEIIIGRILGISAIGGVVLAVMSVIGYVWIVRQIPKEAQSFLSCRVPVYGSISFIDRNGEPGSGVNVGDIWAFRQFIEGASKARARWLFMNVDANHLDKDGFLNLENSFSAFRSYKGDMTRPLFYDIKLVNPDKQIAFTTDPQPVNEFRSKLDKIPRKVVVDDVERDLIDDFVIPDFVYGNDQHAKNVLLVEVACLDREQYIGMARPDLFIRMPDRPFWVGYGKAIIGIGFIVLLVSMIGVAASSVVKGPIATVLTFVLYLLSGKKAHEFMDQLVTGEFKGGGVLESIYRLVTHMNPSTELPESPAVFVMQKFDMVLTSFLWLCKQIIPRLQSFNMTEFVANGFDVPIDLSMLPSLLVTAAYIIPCVLLGYFALRIRELESK